jgi:hypothetical protein
LLQGLLYTIPRQKSSIIFKKSCFFKKSKKFRNFFCLQF